MPSATRYDDLARAITESYSQLPNRLQGIARFALGNPDAMALSTVAEIAQEAGVPPSAVIRFANALGYPGFTDLQRIYRERLVARSATYRERIEQMRRTGGDKGHVLPQLVDTSIRELERLREHFDVRRLQAATELVLAANAVYLLAQRRAFPVAGYLAYGLAQLEIRAFLLDSVGGHAAPAGWRDRAGRRTGRGELPQLHGRGGRSRGTRPRPRRGRRRHHRSSGVAAGAGRQGDAGDRRRPAVQFRSLVAPLCAAQALVMSVGYALTERNGRKPAAQKSSKRPLTAEAK